ncbi:hypothetical protein DMC25_00585 [Caulobacter sp. D4A]|nr:hypothetical protein DMC25_00585 [Caulobacter sp. D4A]
MDCFQVFAPRPKTPGFKIRQIGCPTGRQPHIDTLSAQPDRQTSFQGSPPLKLEWIFRVSAPLRAAPVVLRYVLASAIILLFFALRLAAAPYMGGFPFLLFFPAIILISALFDRGTGVFAVLLSAGMAWYFFVPTFHSFELPNLKDALPLALYVLIGLFLAVTVEALRSTAERLAKTSLALERANDFNKLLIEDIIHRVKNHLASVNGLLHLSFREISDPDAQRAVKEATGRIGVLGRLYSRLHLSDEATSICARDYICSICDDLRDGVIGVRPVGLRVDVARIDIGSMAAVPIGLIVNELVENALKYAFPDDRAGVITVAFDRDGLGKLHLAVADDGVGFDPASSRKGGGTRLVHSLVQQLHGELERSGPPGTAYDIRFPSEPLGSMR